MFGKVYVYFLWLLKLDRIVWIWDYLVLLLNYSNEKQDENIYLFTYFNNLNIIFLSCSKKKIGLLHTTSTCSADIIGKSDELFKDDIFTVCIATIDCV